MDISNGKILKHFFIYVFFFCRYYGGNRALSNQDVHIATNNSVNGSRDFQYEISPWQLMDKPLNGIE